MRIIAGRWRGRVLEAPPGRDTRPILDRVKVSLFDHLGSLLALPGHLPSLAVLDLFAGSGSLGLESLSRGAAFAAFVERDPRAFATLRRNLDTLGVGDEANAVRRDALRPPWPDPPPGERYDLVFVDPPYAMARDTSTDAAVPRLCRQFVDAPQLATDVRVVIRHECRVVLEGPATGGLHLDKRLEYGNMAVTILRRCRESVSTHDDSPTDSR